MKKRIIFPIILLVSLSLACSFFGSQGEGGALSGPDQSSGITQPTPTYVLPTAEPTTPVEGAQGRFFREEFDKNLDSWRTMYIVGNDEEDAVIQQNNNRLKIELPRANETHLKIYNLDETYADVIVRTEVENFGSNSNGMSVMCRVSDAGWYEFRISSGGTWGIYRFDGNLNADGKNPYVALADGASAEINMGTNLNLIEMACVGSDFRFYINGKLLNIDLPKATKAEFRRYPEGGVGVGAYSLNEASSPVVMEFTWFETDQP